MGDNDRPATSGNCAGQFLTWRLENNAMRLLVNGLAVMILVAACGAAEPEKETKVIKVTADEIAKEFKDDAAAAKKKYAEVEIEITGTATLAIGPANDREVLVDNESKIPIRLGVKDVPANFPAKFTATVKFKGYFDMAKELALTATKVTYK
jgi:hypothetical protein